MNKDKILAILETAVDKNGNIPMRLVRLAFKKLPEPCEDVKTVNLHITKIRKHISDFSDLNEDMDECEDNDKLKKAREQNERNE